MSAVWALIALRAADPRLGCRGHLSRVEGCPGEPEGSWRDGTCRCVLRRAISEADTGASNVTELCRSHGVSNLVRLEVRRRVRPPWVRQRWSRGHGRRIDPSGRTPASSESMTRSSPIRHGTSSIGIHFSEPACSDGSAARTARRIAAPRRRCHATDPDAQVASADLLADVVFAGAQIPIGRTATRPRWDPRNGSEVSGDGLRLDDRLTTGDPHVVPAAVRGPAR